MHAFDPRTTLARDDLAEQALEGIVRAGSYRPTRSMQCVAEAAAIRRRADAASEQLDQLIFGEGFEVLEIVGDWAWGRARRDDYVGWVATAELAPEMIRPTHRVSALRTYAFPEPDLKAPHGLVLTLNALVTVEAEDGRWVKVARAGWVPAEHLSAFDAFERDPVSVAERYLGSPYQWGGRDSVGVDCSGLVQQALYACGRGCPRDADMQERETGAAIDPAAGLRRGDLVFWKDHVALMLDAERIIHANGFHAQVAIEPLAEAMARNRASGMGEPTAYRRL